MTTNLRDDNGRIRYIDLMKGIAVLGVILHHTNLYLPENLDITLTCIRLPIFFFISGMFVKMARPTGQFLLKRFNRLIVPMVFFSLVYLAIVAAVPHLRDIHFSHAGDTVGDHHGLIYDLYIFFVVPANAPLWFLPCLFTATVILHFVIKACRRHSRILVPAAIAVLAAVGLFLARSHWSVVTHDFGNGPLNEFIRFTYRMHISESMIMLPVMYCGYLVAGAGLHERRPGRAVSAGLAVGALVMLILLPVPVMPSLHFHVWNPVMWLFSAAGIVLLMVVCMNVDHLPVVSYMGRYSLICLCVHNIIIALIEPFIYSHVTVNPEAATAAVTVAATLLLIEPCRRYLAPFTGGADLISLRPGLSKAPR